MISLLCPTRGRPDRFAAMVASFWEHTAGDFEVCCVMDHDDPRLYDYDCSLIDRVHVSNRGRIGSSALYNGCAQMATGAYMMMVNDDSLMRTPGWDVIMIEAMPSDMFCVAWPMSQGCQCTNPMISRQWYDALGYFVPPGYMWWYCDTALRTISDKVGRSLWVPAVHCEHMFHMFGKSEMDDTYRRNSDEQERARDRERFQKDQRRLAEEAGKIARAIIRASGYCV